MQNWRKNGISYKISENTIHTGKDLTKLIEEEKYQMFLVNFEAGVRKAIQEFKADQRAKAKTLNDLFTEKK